MNLDISYAEFSYVRELVKKEQLRLWKEKWLPLLTAHGKRNILTVYSRVMRRKTILTDEGCCSLLLAHIDDAEKKVQELLKHGLKGGKK